MSKSKPLSDSYKSFEEIRTPVDLNISKRCRTNSLDSLANSSNLSESQSDDSDSETRSFTVKCEVYAQTSCGSVRSWTLSNSSNSENCYEYVASDVGDKKSGVDKRLDMIINRMETIPEENAEPKISVKEILARFENLKETKDANNNINGSISITEQCQVFLENKSTNQQHLISPVTTATTPSSNDNRQNVTKEVSVLVT